MPLLNQYDDSFVSVKYDAGDVSCMVYFLGSAVPGIYAIGVVMSKCGVCGGHLMWVLVVWWPNRSHLGLVGSS